MRKLIASAFVLLAMTATVASAKTTVRCVVPKLTGLTLSQAKTRLRTAHCSPGSVKTIKGTGTLEVSAQSPAAGRRAKKGTRVSLTLKPKAASTPVAVTTTKTTATITPAQTVAPVAPVATSISLTAPGTSTGDGTGDNYFVVTASLSNASGGAVAGLPVTFSIVAGYPAQTVATFSGTSGTACTIVESEPTDSSTETISGQAEAGYPSCALSAKSVSSDDLYQLAVSFAGNSSYLASSSASDVSLG